MRPSILVALVALAPTLADAQARKPGRTITLDEAREILGTNPVAIPDVPIQWIYRQSTYTIMLQQQPEAGSVVTLIETRGEYALAAPRRSLTPAEMTRDPVRAVQIGEDRLRYREVHRVFPGVTVRYMGSEYPRVRHDLIDRLEPIPPGSTPGATQSAPPPR